MKGKKGVKAKRPPGVRALDRLVWAAARLETAVNRRHVTTLRKACDAWLRAYAKTQQASIRFLFAIVGL